MLRVFAAVGRINRISSSNHKKIVLAIVGALSDGRVVGEGANDGLFVFKGSQIRVRFCADDGASRPPKSKWAFIDELSNKQMILATL